MTSSDILTSRYWEGWLQDPVPSFTLVNPVPVFVLFYLLTCAFTGCCIYCFKLCRGSDDDKVHLSGVDEEVADLKKENNAVTSQPSGLLDRVTSFKRGDSVYSSMGSPEIGQSSSSAPRPVLPAYNTGQDVEYFSATHGKWLAAEAVSKVVVPGEEDLESGPHEEVLYSTILEGTSQQRLGVTLDMLRVPLKPGEVCEIFDTQGRRNEWVLAEVESRQVSRMQIIYSVRHRGEAKQLEKYPASAVRRVFAPGDSIEMYEGPFQGWVPAEVKEGAQGTLQEHGLQRMAAKSFWKMVPVQAEVRWESEMLPSYLLRPSGSPRVKPRQPKKKTSSSASSKSGGTTKQKAGDLKFVDFREYPHMIVPYHEEALPPVAPAPTIMDPWGTGADDLSSTAQGDSSQADSSGSSWRQRTVADFSATLS